MLSVGLPNLAHTRLIQFVLSALLVVLLLLGSAAEAATCGVEADSTQQPGVSVSLASDHQESSTDDQGNGCVHGHCHHFANAAEPAAGTQAQFDLRASTQLVLYTGAAGIQQPILTPPPKR